MDAQVVDRRRHIQHCLGKRGGDRARLSTFAGQHATACGTGPRNLAMLGNGVGGIWTWISRGGARHRHWPIVFVGLFGKVMGPIGFVWTAWQGTIAWKFGANILTNDLIWWIPFGLMLLAARRAWLDSIRS